MKRSSIFFNFLLIAPITILAFFLSDETKGQSASAFVSDDFRSSTLNSALWTFINPNGDGKLTMTGAQAWISVPAGTSHDVWTNGNQAPRIKQSARDGDFTIEVKFESPVRQLNQMQGIFVEQDGNNFLRFDFHYDGNKTRIFAVALKAGTRSVKTNLAIAAGLPRLPLYMRAKREAQQWTQFYSYDGTNWINTGSFTEVLTVTAVGAFVGNSGLDAPAHTGIIDYFFNTASPIQPEDGGRHTVTVNVIGDGKVVRNPDQPTYRPGEIVNLTANPASGLRFHGWSSDQSGSNNPLALTLTKDQIIMATFTLGDHPTIDLWYGPNQIFGHLGTPQRWINILGNVSDYDDIASLTYSLNSGSQLPLVIGRGNPRLVAAGDFNVEMACKDLVSGQNQVILTATDKLGNTTVKAVTVELSKGAVWPLPYSVEWNSATNIQQVAQIVDGKWAVEANRLRTNALGAYDRLIAIGDTTWKDYEVTVPITIHGFDMRSTGAIIGILMRWDGHRDWGGNKPFEGWWPMGAIGVYQPRASNNSSGYLRMVGDQSVDLTKAADKQLALGVPYIFKMRVETTMGQGGLYKLKVWLEGTPEPSEWELVAQEGPSDPASGSFLLVAHNTDASFGKVTVTPVTKVTISSDHFNSEKLNTAVWKFIDPVGDATLTMTGKEVAIAVPAGISHGIWNNGNFAPRLMQPASNTDFEIEVKFSSKLSKGFQMFGVLIEESTTNFLRFDFHHDGSSTRIFAATFTNGIATTKINTNIRPGVPLYMRVKRENDRWTQSYSYDRKNWTISIDFVHALSVSAVGAFVGNTGSSPPAHTGWIDYFFNTAVPIIDSTRTAVKTTVTVPARFELHQNYPNPFNPQTTIEFSLPTPGFVTFKVFTARGEEVAVLMAKELAPGPHKTVWNAKALPSGVYFYRLSIASPGKPALLTATKKLLLVK